MEKELKERRKTTWKSYWTLKHINYIKTKKTNNRIYYKYTRSLYPTSTDIRNTDTSFDENKTGKIKNYPKIDGKKHTEYQKERQNIEYRNKKKKIKRRM